MPGGIRSDIKFGFWAGLGFILLVVVAMFVQMGVSRVSGSRRSGG